MNDRWNHKYPPPKRGNKETAEDILRDWLMYRGDPNMSEEELVRRTKRVLGHELKDNY